MVEYYVLRKKWVYLIVLVLYLAMPKCHCESENEKYEEILDIDFSDVKSKEVFDPFDLLNYDRQKMLKSKKLTTAKHTVDGSFNPFDPLDLNRKQQIKKSLNLEGENLISVEIVGARDVTDDLSVVSQDLAADENHSEFKSNEEISSKKSTMDSNCKCETEILQCEEDPVVARERPILRRFVQSLYSTLSLQNIKLKDGDVLHFSLSAKITQRAYGILHDIVSMEGDIKKKKLADLDEILFGLLKLETSQQDESISLSLLEIINSINMHPKDWIPLVFLIYLSIIIIMLQQHRSIFSIVSTSFILFICVSWYWHWHHLYQQTLSKRQSDSLKYSEMPSSCKPGQLSSFQAALVWLSYFIPGDDPCEKYHEVLMTDPVYQVTPIMALSDTLAAAIFHPLGYIGQQIGQFFIGVLDASNWYAKIPIFVTVVFLLVISLVLGCGYEIHMPLFMGSIKPARREKARPLDVMNVPQVEAVTSGPEQRGPGTPPQPIMVVVKVVTDAVGDSKVQKISELSADLPRITLPANDGNLSDSVEISPSLESCNRETKSEINTGKDELEINKNEYEEENLDRNILESNDLLTTERV